MFGVVRVMQFEFTLPISVTPSCSSTARSAVQPANILVSNFVTLTGILTYLTSCHLECFPTWSISSSALPTTFAESPCNLLESASMHAISSLASAKIVSISPLLLLLAARSSFSTSSSTLLRRKSSSFFICSSTSGFKPSDSSMTFTCFFHLLSCLPMPPTLDDWGAILYLEPELFVNA